MTLRVLEAGLCSLLVDQGRPGYRNLGVPLGGAADRTSLTLGNALVGNPPDAVALEISLAGPTLQATADIGCVVFGAPFALMRNDRHLEPGKTFTLRANDELAIGGTSMGMRAYLCVRGGFHVAAVLGSGSGLEPIKAGSELACSPGPMHTRFVDERSLDVMPPAGSIVPLRVVTGLQAGWFQEAAFFEQDYLVTPSSNRMGLRLESKPLTLRGPLQELISEPVCPGTVQVTQDGQCILLGVDGQTIGGYPKIAHVIQADLDHLGQLRPGARIRFVRVDFTEAVEAYRQKRKELNLWVTRLRDSLAGLHGRSPGNV